MTADNPRPAELDENPYASPREDGDFPADADLPKDPNSIDRPVFYRALRYAFIQQGIVLIVAALVLDGGDTFHWTMIAAILSWVPVAAIALRRASRRRSALSNLDLTIIRHGFWAFFFGMAVLYYSGLLPSNFYHVNRIPRPPNNTVGRPLDAPGE
jgi:hypothetical protein